MPVECRDKTGFCGLIGNHSEGVHTVTSQLFSEVADNVVFHAQDITSLEFFDLMHGCLIGYPRS